MTKKQAISLKYNKILFVASVVAFVGELLFAVISYHRAIPKFIELLRQDLPSDFDYAAPLMPFVIFPPEKFQFFFFAIMILLILSFFRFYSVPDKMRVRIPDKFRKPVNVDFTPSKFQTLIEADPQYARDIRAQQDGKAYERTARRQFFITSIVLLLALYLSIILFGSYAMETVAGWYAPGNLFSKVSDFLQGFFKQAQIEPQYFIPALCKRYSQFFFIFAIIYIIYKYATIKEFKTDYQIEDYNRDDFYCDACGYAAVDILKKTNSVLSGTEKIGTERDTVVTQQQVETTTDSNGYKSERVKAVFQITYEYDVFKLTFDDTYKCRSCRDATKRESYKRERRNRREVASGWHSK